MISIKGNAVSKIDRGSKEYKSLQAFHERLKSKDSTIWGPEAQAEAARPIWDAPAHWKR